MHTDWHLVSKTGQAADSIRPSAFSSAAEESPLQAAPPGDEERTSQYGPAAPSKSFREMLLHGFDSSQCLLCLFPELG